MKQPTFTDLKKGNLVRLRSTRRLVMFLGAVNGAVSYRSIDDHGTPTGSIQCVSAADIDYPIRVGENVLTEQGPAVVRMISETVSRADPVLVVGLTNAPPEEKVLRVPVYQSKVHRP